MTSLYESDIVCLCAEYLDHTVYWSEATFYQRIEQRSVLKHFQVPIIM